MKRSLSIPIAALALALAPRAWSTARQDAGDTLAERLVAACERSFEEHDLPGMAIAIGVGSDTFLAAGWGSAGPGEAADEESLFRVGSLTQQLIALGVLDLERAGQVALDDDVAEHVVEMDYERERITLLDLLQHSSGLPQSEDVLLALGGAPTTERVLAWLPGQALHAEPGTCAVHSGVNTLLLGLVLERKTGLSVREHVERRIVERLGLEQTRYCDDGPPLRPFDASLQEVGAGVVNDALGPAFFDAEALCASAADVLQLQRAIAAREILSDRQVQLLTADDRFPDGTPIAYRGGFSRTALGDLEGLAFGGGMAGGRVHAVWYPALDLTIVVLAAAESAPAAAIAKRLVRVFIGEPDPTALDEKLPPEVRARYVGGYYVGCTRYLVVEDGERLQLIPPGGPAFVLLAQGHHAFLSADDPDVRLTFQVEGERARSFVLDDHGTEVVAVRVE